MNDTAYLHAGSRQRPGDAADVVLTLLCQRPFGIDLLGCCFAMLYQLEFHVLIPRFPVYSISPGDRLYAALVQSPDVLISICGPFVAQIIQVLG